MGYPRENMDLRINLVNMEDRFWVRRIKLDALQDSYRMMPAKNYSLLQEGDCEQDASIVEDGMSHENVLLMVNSAESATR